MNRNIYVFLVVVTTLAIGFAGYITPPTWESWDAWTGIPVAIGVVVIGAALVFGGKLWTALIGASMLWFTLGTAISGVLRSFGFGIFDAKHLTILVVISCANVALLFLATRIFPSSNSSTPEPNSDDAGKGMGAIAMLGYFGLPFALLELIPFWG